MRRLDGVTHVQLDTVKQIACVYIGEPTKLHFEDFIEAAVDAAYTTAAMKIEAVGVIERSACEECGQTQNFILLKGSGQKFELDTDDLQPGDTLRLKANVIGWNSDHPVLVPID